ncbi:MAG: DUF4292 domain-containing protein [Bacteroidaceae bacterium]|nr:DUF4292 domain-containing protein [Bacteroidaceae bacterium]
MNKLKQYIAFSITCITMCWGLTACKSTKPVTPTDAPAANTTTIFDANKYLSMVTSNNTSQANLTAKVKVVVDVDGKSNSTSGSLKMKKNDVIQISLVDPLLGVMELGRMEFTKTRVLIIDRVNKQYVDLPYSDVSFLKQANIDFNTLQSLFWHEVFEPGKSSTKSADFQFKDNGDNIDIMFVDHMLTYKFATKKQQGQLRETVITNNTDKNYRFAFNYDNFTTFYSKPFPREMIMSFTASSQTTSLSLTLSSLKNSSDWTTRSSAPSKYTKADPEKLFKALAK